MKTHTQTKHTPGPWTVTDNGYGITGHNGGTLVVETGLHKWESLDAASAGGGAVVSKMLKETEANARLIAAAPELLAVLKELAEWEGPQYATHRALQGFQADARAAIARAEGREET